MWISRCSLSLFVATWSTGRQSPLVPLGVFGITSLRAANLDDGIALRWVLQRVSCTSSRCHCSRSTDTARWRQGSHWCPERPPSRWLPFLSKRLIRSVEAQDADHRQPSSLRRCGACVPGWPSARSTGAMSSPSCFRGWCACSAWGCASCPTPRSPCAISASMEMPALHQGLIQRAPRQVGGAVILACLATAAASRSAGLGGTGGRRPCTVTWLRVIAWLLI